MKIKVVLAKQSPKQKSYRKFFKRTMKKHDVDPSKLHKEEPAKVKKAFNAIKKGWNK